MSRPTRESVLTKTNHSASTYAGVVVRDEDLRSAVLMLTSAAVERRAVAIHLCNAYTLTLAARDPSFARVLGHRAANLPDGVPVTWFARLQTGRPQRGPVRGPSLMREALRHDGLRHFFLGGTPDVLERLRGVASSLNPQLSVAGAFAPDYRPVTAADLHEWAERIEASGANVVWVGLGTPKQDHVLAELVDRVDAVVVGVGAAFDFLSATKREAPTFLHGTGLEWVFRLAVEPRRLWKRYLIGNAQFVFHALASLRSRP